MTPHRTLTTVLAASALALLTATTSYAAPAITDVAAGTGLAGNFNDEFANTCQGDLNGDGLPDLVISQHDRKPTLIMLNNGDYTYRQAQALDNGDPHGCAIYRSTDGTLHLLFAIGAYHGLINNKQNIDWQLDATGHATEQPGFFGTTDPGGRGRQIVPVRMLEGRGIYLANTIPVDHPSTNHLYLEDRPGHFADIGAPFTATSYGQSGDAADLDGDGADEIVATGGQRIRLWHETSPGRWIDVAPSWGVTTSARRARFGDFNGDGHPDLVTSGDKFVCTYLWTGGRLVLTSKTPTTAGRSVYIGDLTGDGNADVYVVRGSVHQASLVNEPDLLLTGDGTGRSFTDRSGLLANVQLHNGGGNDITRIPSPAGTTRLLVTNGGDMNDQQSGAHQVLQFPATG